MLLCYVKIYEKNINVCQYLVGKTKFLTPTMNFPI